MGLEDLVWVKDILQRLEVGATIIIDKRRYRIFSAPCIYESHNNDYVFTISINGRGYRTRIKDIRHIQLCGQEKTYANVA